MGTVVQDSAMTGCMIRAAAAVLAVLAVVAQASSAQGEIEKAMALIGQARSMSEVDFQINKSLLAEKVAFIDRKEEILKELDELSAGRKAPPGKVADILLDPRIIPVLERRLALMKNGGKDPAADLEDIEGADTCKGGKCGTPVKKE